MFSTFGAKPRAGLRSLPLSEVADAASLVALKVLPVYGPALFAMEQFDEAREHALGELQKIIDPSPGKEVSSPPV